MGPPPFQTGLSRTRVCPPFAVAIGARHIILYSALLLALLLKYWFVLLVVYRTVRRPGEWDFLFFLVLHSVSAPLLVYHVQVIFFNIKNFLRVFRNIF